MSHSFLKKTTALTLSLSIAMMPVTGFAQTADEPELLCADGTAQPCSEGVDVAPATKKAKRAAKAAAEAAAAAEADAAAGVNVETDDANAKAQADAAAAADVQAAADAEAAAAAKKAARAAKAQEEAAAQAAAEEAATAQAAADAAAAAAAAADADDATKAAAQAAAEEATAAQAAAEDAANAAVKAEADAAEKADADAAAQADADAAAQAEADAAAQAEADAAAGVDAAGEVDADAAAKAATDAAAAAEAGTVAPDEAAAEDTKPKGKKAKARAAAEAAAAAAAIAALPADAGEASAADIAEEPKPTAEADLPPANLPVPEALAGAVAAAEGEAAAVDSKDVRTERVTKRRKSNEDFATAPGAVVQAEEKDRLSDFEKFGLVALAAIAVGAVLNNNRVVTDSGDRVVVQQGNGQYVVLKDDDALLREPGATVQTQRYTDGSTLTTINRADGTKVVTIRDAYGRVLRRAYVAQDGTQTLLIDDTQPSPQVVVSELPRYTPTQPYVTDDTDGDALRLALADTNVAGLDRRFSLRQIREIREVRELAPQIDLNSITFATGSAAVLPDQAEKLSALGGALLDLIKANPGEVFLIEGHTDAVGAAPYNLALSDRRAESVALVLTEYFGVPAQNLVVQGYGESYLKVRTLAGEQANRRVAVRRITQLLQTAAN